LCSDKSRLTGNGNTAGFEPAWCPTISAIASFERRVLIAILDVNLFHLFAGQGVLFFIVVGVSSSPGGQS
jgi:hypothetical protein